MKEINSRYGTKKSIEEAKKKHSLNQEDNPKTQQELDGGIKEALESTYANTARNIPPYDASACSPQEAYHWTRSSSRESGVSLKIFLSFCKWEQKYPHTLPNLCLQQNPLIAGD